MIRDRKTLREMQQRAVTPDPVDERVIDAAGGAPVAVAGFVYKATSDESNGTITAKLVDSNGNVVGENVTLRVLP